MRRKAPEGALMMLKGRLERLEGRGGSAERELICAASEHEAEMIRDAARLAGKPRPAVIVTADATPGSPQSFGTVRAVLERIAIHNRPLHLRQFDDNTHPHCSA